MDRVPGGGVLFFPRFFKNESTTLGGGGGGPIFWGLVKIKLLPGSKIGGGCLKFSVFETSEVLQ